MRVKERRKETGETGLVFSRDTSRVLRASLRIEGRLGEKERNCCSTLRHVQPEFFRVTYIYTSPPFLRPVHVLVPKLNIVISRTYYRHVRVREHVPLPRAYCREINTRVFFLKRGKLRSISFAKRK